MSKKVHIRFGTEADLPLILQFIKELAEYERLLHEVVATEKQLHKILFDTKSNAEVIIGYLDEQPAGFALFFQNYSSFLAKPGLYLEDLFVRPEARGHGLGKIMLVYVAKLAKERGCGRFEWSVLDWNEPALEFYKKLGAKSMDEWTVQRVSGQALNDLADKYREFETS